MLVSTDKKWDYALGMIKIVGYEDGQERRHGYATSNAEFNGSVHFEKWIENYPFYSNIHKEGVILYRR